MIPFIPVQGQPVRDQLKNQLKNAILMGQLLPGQRLETGKELACHLAVNPYMVEDILKELEAESYLTRTQEGELRVAEAASWERRQKESLLEQYREFSLGLLQAGISSPSLEAALKEAIEIGEKNHESDND